LEEGEVDFEAVFPFMGGFDELDLRQCLNVLDRIHVDWHIAKRRMKRGMMAQGQSGKGDVVRGAEQEHALGELPRMLHVLIR